MTNEYSEIARKYHEWDSVFHEMKLLQSEEHLTDSLTTHPIVLLLGPTELVDKVITKVADPGSPIGKTKGIIHVYSHSNELRGTQAKDSSTNRRVQDADSHTQQKLIKGGYIAPESPATFELYGISKEGLRENNKMIEILSRSDVVISIGEDSQSALGDILQKEENISAPLLWLDNNADNKHILSTADSHSIQYRPNMNIEQILNFLLDIGKYWPCLLAQRLEREVRSVMDGDVPRLKRWRMYWLASVLSLDAIVLTVFIWIVMHFKIQNIYSFHWVSMPTLLAAASLFLLTIISAFFVLVIWQSHRNSCSICSSLFYLFSARLGRKKSLLFAFRKNITNFTQALSCRDLCGWTCKEQENAQSFCKYCQNLRNEIFINDL